MTGTNAELIAWGKMLGGREQELADALEAATLTATEDALYIKRMEAERDAAMSESINESNWGAFAAVVLEAESAHWQAEYESLTNKYGAFKATKTRAAWKLGATMLLRRAERYREDDVRITVARTEAAK